MEARELIDLIWPEHDRTSCDDKEVQNGFGTMGLRHKETDELLANGRCFRCMVLEVERGYCRDLSDIPADGLKHLREDW